MYIYLYPYACNSHHHSTFDADVEKCTVRIFNPCLAKRVSLVRTFSSSHLNKQGKYLQKKCSPDSANFF